MKRVKTFLLVCVGVAQGFAQTELTVPDTIMNPGNYIVVPAGGTFQIDTTGVGFIRAALWIAGTDSSSDSRMVPCVDDVFIDGQNATLIGYGPEDRASTEFGVWFQNDLRALPAVEQDTTYRDTVANFNIQKFWYGVVFRQIADGVISNCTIDSCQKGIELASSNYNVRNKIIDNILSNTSDRGINVRGSKNLIENNTITNSSDYAHYGIYIDRTYSQGNEIKNNTIEGGDQAAIIFSGAFANITDGNVISNAHRGIWASGTAHDNVVQNDEITNCDMGLVYEAASNDMATGVTLTGNKVAVHATSSREIVVENSSISESDSLDVVALGNSIIFLDKTEFDTSKVSVDATSVIYLGQKHDVQVTVTANGEQLTMAANLMVKNTKGDTLIKYTSDTTGVVSFSLGEWAILASTEAGKSDAQNPFTFYAMAMDTSAMLVATVTSDTSFTIDITVTALPYQSTALPTWYALMQNYPNPFNPETVIQYQLPKTTQVKIEIFNVLGQLVTTLVDEEQTAGYKSVSWDGRNNSKNHVGSGLYFYVMKAGEFKTVKRMLLIR